MVGNKQYMRPKRAIERVYQETVSAAEHGLREAHRVCLEGVSADASNHAEMCARMHRISLAVRDGEDAELARICEGFSEKELRALHLEAERRRAACGACVEQEEERFAR